MRAVVQRVSRARVAVDRTVVGEINHGLLVLLGVAHADSEADADYLAKKIAGLRIFEDANGKMNLDTAAVGGGILVVSQFTLYGDVRRGNVRRSTPQPHRSAPASFMSTLWNASEPSAFPARPAVSRK
jgi:D-aminoacyl-tRNA deacylase